MTIENSIEIVDDAFSVSQWPLFDRNKALTLYGHIPRIGILSLLAKDRRMERTVNGMDRACIELFQHVVLEKVLEDSREEVWLFIADSVAGDPNRVRMYKRLWKKLPADLLGEHMDPYPDVAIHLPEGVRFAGLAAVDRTALSKAFQVQSLWTSYLLLTSRSHIAEPEPIHDMFASAFPMAKDTLASSINWMTLACHLCPKGDILVRLTGEYDTRESVIDCFMSSERLKDFPSKLS